MTSYKTQQHRLVHRGRTFHFVSYDGTPANEKRHEVETGPTWHLMLAGKRWMVGAQAAETAPEELDRQFAAWLDSHVFAGAPAGPFVEPRVSAGAATLAGPAEALRAIGPPVQR